MTMVDIKIVERDLEDPSLNNIYVKVVKESCNLDKEISKFMREILDRNNVGNIFYEFMPTKFRLVKDSTDGAYARIETDDMDCTDEIYVYIERSCDVD